MGENTSASSIRMRRLVTRVMLAVSCCSRCCGLATAWRTPSHAAAHGGRGSRLHAATPDGESQVKLSRLCERKPVVLVFGSFTCPPFRNRVLRVQELSDMYKGRAEFLMVYIREAHPDSIIRVREDGREVLKKIEQAANLAVRSRNAGLCMGTLKLSFAAVVDKDDKRVNAAYGGWPSRIVAVDRQMRIAFDGGAGPAVFTSSATPYAFAQY